MSVVSRPTPMVIEGLCLSFYPIIRVFGKPRGIPFFRRRGVEIGSKFAEKMVERYRFFLDARSAIDDQIARKLYGIRAEIGGGSICGSSLK